MMIFIELIAGYTNKESGLSDNLINDLIDNGNTDDSLIDWDSLVVNVNHIVGFNRSTNPDRIALRLSDDTTWDVKITVERLIELLRNHGIKVYK